MKRSTDDIEGTAKAKERREVHNREEGEMARKSREEGEIGAKM